MSQILNHYGSDWQSYEWHLIKKKKNAQISSEPATNASSINDHPKHRQQIRSRGVTQTLQTVKRHDQSTRKDPVYSLIDVLYTQTLAKDQIETLVSTHSMKLRSYWFHPIFCLPL